MSTGPVIFRALFHPHAGNLLISVARASVALVIILLSAPRIVAGQVADTTTGVRLRFDYPALRLVQPPALRAPWLGGRSPTVTAFDSAISAALDSSRVSRASALRTSAIYGVAQQVTTDSGIPAPTPVADAPRAPVGLQKYADLSLDGQAKLDIRTERVRNERCTAEDANLPDAGCRGGIRLPRLENQISVRSAGTISQRVHVNVDYDADRDFTAANNIQVYYEGLPDEIVRRVEVGTVTFRPPASRFLTAAVPQTNFGVNGLFEVGPMQFQTLIATQKGSAVAERLFNVGTGSTSQPQDRTVRDLDFESGRFFWVVDPTTVPGYPAIDVLTLQPDLIAAALRPNQVRLYRYTAPTTGAVNPNLGGIRAFANNLASATFSQNLGQPLVDEGVEWALLEQGRDYYLDPSGLWFVLANKIGPRDHLAVSYTTEGGGIVGTFPAADRPQAVDSLRLIAEPLRGPEAGTFRHEMRQIYRVAGADLQLNSLAVSLSLNRSERPADGLATYLAQLGLSIPTDPSVFDRENRLFPRPRDPSADEVVRERFLVFPHLQPFSDASRLTAAERSDSLYRTPLHLLLSQGPPARFQFRLRYDAAGGTDRSTLSLDALQIKEGSDQLSIGGRPLLRGTDYTIDYATGLVTFLDPVGLFGNTGAQVTARFEQQDLFAVAPTTILGLTSRYSLGELGSVNLIGVLQREATAYNRPQLGFESKANMVAGVTTDLHFQSLGLTRLLDRLTAAPAVAPSRVDINAELAFSRPDPNRSGQAYLEEFESDVGLPLSLSELVWEFGSIPQSTVGLDPLLGFGTEFDPDDAVALTWQNLIPGADGQPLRLRPQDIDTTIVTAGRGDLFETAMFLTLHADTAGGFVKRNNSSQWTQPVRPSRPRWRSMVTSLSSTGIDLSRSEYLEFYVFQSGLRAADSAGVQLIVDLGTVNEDALALAPATLTLVGADSLFEGRQYPGRGQLDTERAADGIFNAVEDDIGILADRPDSIRVEEQILRDPELCRRRLTGIVPVFPWGDLSSRCTVGNGHLDSEDLNGDLLLNARGPNEDVFRYVVDLSDPAFKVPNRGVKSIDGNGRETGWTLYRVPLRGDQVVSIGGPTLRLVQHLRVTVVAPPDAGTDVVARFALARMRIVGAPWIRRAETPILGIAGSTGVSHGEVLTAVVSTENTELGYTSPPGTGNLLNDRNAGQGSLGTQINEKSLRIIARELEVGERAEAYHRFPAGPQNLLNYRELRVWARGRGAGWERGDLKTYVKLGSDDRNFYMFIAPASTTTWEPEMVVDLEAWRRLRATLEERWLAGAPPSGAAECGGDIDAYVVCEGPYLVHLADPTVSPPNLAAVQEIATGLIRVADNGALPEAEVWIDDIRLAIPIAELGKAMAIDARLAAADVGDLTLSYQRQDGQFRQIGQTPSYRTTGTALLSSSWRLDRFLPQSLGLAMPLTLTFTRTGVDPQLIGGTDIRGSSLPDLRRPHSWSSAYGITIRRSQRGTSWITRGLVDPFTLTGTLIRGRARTELNRAATSSWNANAAYTLVLQRNGPLLDLSGILPGFLRNTETGKALKATRLSLTPSTVRFSSGLSRDEGQFTTYPVAVVRPIDAALTPTLSLNHVWRNNASIGWQPLGMITLNGDLTSTRDLRNYSDSTPIGRLAGQSRKAFLGTDVGVERDRQFATSLALTPRLTSWLRPRFTSRSNFTLSRSLTSRAPVLELIDDTLGGFILPQTLNNNRANELGASIDIARLVRGIAGDSSTLTPMFSRMRPLDLSSRLARNSTFDLAAFQAPLRYQLGLGGRDDFLLFGDIPAIGAGETRTKAISTGADFPFGLSFTVTYGNTDALRFQAVSSAFRVTRTETRDWPVGSARWSRTFGRGPLTLVAFGATFRERNGTTTQPTTVGETVSGISSSTLTPDLQVGFRNGMRLTLQYSATGQSQLTGASTTLTDNDNVFGTLNYSFRMPEWLTRSRKTVRTTLSARSDRSSSCLRTGSVDAPAATCDNVVSQTINQEISASMQTDLAQAFTGGLDFGYTVSEARHINRKISTIFLTVSFQVTLFAGEIR